MGGPLIDGALCGLGHYSVAHVHGELIELDDAISVPVGFATQRIDKGNREYSPVLV